ncbi:MAG: LptA/OstA family protein [Verrucomicrobiia bacterium]
MSRHNPISSKPLCPLEGKPPPRRSRCQLAFAAAAFIAISHGSLAQTDGAAQPPGAFTVPVYEEGSSRVIAVLHGSGRFDLKTSRQVLDTVQVDYRDALGKTNMVMSGKNCIYDFKSKTAVSSEPLRVATGDARLQLEGTGFVWYQTNKNLVISNDVRTIVRKRTTATLPTEEQNYESIELRADRFAFDYNSNLLSYYGNVKLQDSQFEVACDTLTIRRSATNTIEEVHATGGVVVSNRLDRTVTTAQTASYVLRDNEERLELLGRPRWTDGVRNGEAERFDIDRRRNILVAAGRARLAIPRDSGRGLAILDFTCQSVAPASTGASNIIEVRADFLRVEQQAQSQGRTNYTFLAETNVSILDVASGARATADRALFGGNSVLTLSGTPVWTSGKRMLRAGTLSYDATTGAFAARTNAVVRFPLLSLTQSSASNITAVARNMASISTNDYIEIHSDEIAYSDGRAVFRPSVKATWLNENAVLGTLTCAELGVTYSNHLERLDAHGGIVFDREPYLQEDGTTVAMHLECDHMSLKVRPEGVPDRLALDGNVVAVLYERPAPAPKPTPKQLLCDSLFVSFGSGSNLVAHAEANGKVLLRQQDRSARADHARYSDSTGKMVLTGNPVITLPEGTISGANEVSWEPAAGRYTVSGKFLSRWKRLPLSTNLSGLTTRKP